MKIKVVVALLLLLCIICGLQLSCSPYAMKIEKVIIERETKVIFDKKLIH